MIDREWRIKLVESHEKILDPGVKLRIRDGWCQIVTEMLESLELERKYDPTAEWQIVTLKEKTRPSACHRSPASARNG